MTHQYFEGSAHASDYAKFRPQTPEIVVSWIMKYLADKCPQDGKEKTFAQAADIGCGTGQVCENNHLLSRESIVFKIFQLNFE